MHTFEIESGENAEARNEQEWTWDVLRYSWFPKWNPWRVVSEGSEERDIRFCQPFKESLVESRTEDVHDLEMLDFIRMGNSDKTGRPTLIFIAQHVPTHVLQQQRTQRFMLQKIESIGKQAFSILYIHTDSQMWDSPIGLKVMSNLFSRIPREYRNRLEHIFVLHPDIYLHATMWFYARWFLYALWEKVQYLHRMEDLQTFFPPFDIALPSFVIEHDAELEEHPLMDYGFVAVNEVDVSNPNLAFYN